MPSRTVPAPRAPAPARHDALATSLARLGRNAQTLRRSIEAFDQGASELRERVLGLEREANELAGRSLACARQTARLETLYVANLRLHESLDRNRVLTAIREIVAGLLGSEDFALWQLSSDGATLVRTLWDGPSGRAQRDMPCHAGPIGRAVRTGKRRISRGGQRPDAGADGTAGPLAVVPLAVDARVTGVLALFSLLPQKPRLTPEDLVLLDMLASHAASALYCTELAASARPRSGAARRPRARTTTPRGRP